MGELRASQSFANDAGSATVLLDADNATLIDADHLGGGLTIAYDVTTNSYTLSVAGRSQTFGPADLIEQGPGYVDYDKAASAGGEYLTLFRVPSTGGSPSQYVGIGLWQRNLISGDQPEVQLSTFTYGLNTPAAAVPRSGTAGFSIVTLGVAAAPGREPRVFEGSGTFSTDFGAGVFKLQSSHTETGLISGEGIVGGGIELLGSGRLSASDGTFSGNILYGGTDADIAGTLSGRFYGPSAQELGASFAAGNANGATVTGSFAGWRDPNASVENLTLTNLTSAQLFYVPFAMVTTTTFDGPGTPYVRTYSSIGQLNRQNSETFTYGPGLSNLPGGQFTINDKVASSDPNFITYRKTFNGQDVQLELYRPGSANTQLALTYASLGRWRTSETHGVVTEASRVFLSYGLETTAQLLSAKTGTARYNGVVFGAGTNEATLASYDVAGTSVFNVNFTDQRYSGSLALMGNGIDGTPSLDFGAYAFAGNLSATTRDSLADLSIGGTRAGELTTRFFGPDGEEIGGIFTLTVPTGNSGAGTRIAGATAAKRE